MRTLIMIRLAVVFTWASIYNLKHRVYGWTYKRQQDFSDFRVVNGTKVDVPPRAENRIALGEDANLLKDAPFMVGLRRTMGGENFCGGALISSRHVLSAAHCNFKSIADAKGNVRWTVPEPELYASIGSVYLKGEDDGERIKVTSRFLHPRYKKHSFSYDAIIFELENEVNIKYQHYADYSMEGLTFNKIRWKSTDEAQLFGWGNVNTFRKIHKSRDLPQHFPDKLQKASLRLMPRMYCQLRYLIIARSDLLCAGYHGILRSPDPTPTACAGDSGSPLVYEGKIIGVMAWGEGKSCGYRPAGFLNVARIENWIDSILRQRGELN